MAHSFVVVLAARWLQSRRNRTHTVASGHECSKFDSWKIPKYEPGSNSVPTLQSLGGIPINPVTAFQHVDSNALVLRVRLAGFGGPADDTRDARLCQPAGVRRVGFRHLFRRVVLCPSAAASTASAKSGSSHSMGGKSCSTVHVTPSIFSTASRSARSPGTVRSSMVISQDVGNDVPRAPAVDFGDDDAPREVVTEDGDGREPNSRGRCPRRRGRGRWRSRPPRVRWRGRPCPSP